VTGEIRKKLFPFIKDSLKFWAPAVISAALIALQMTVLNKWPRLIARGKARTGYSGISDFWLNRFWNEFFPKGYGPAGKYLIWGSTVLFFAVLILIFVKRLRQQTIEGRIQRILSLMGIMLLPCYMQIYLFKNHSWLHQYTIVKFSLPLALIPFILCPLLLAQLLKPYLRKLYRSIGSIFKTSPGRIEKFACAAGVFMLVFGCSFYALSAHIKYQQYFTKNNTLEIHNKQIQPYILVGQNTYFEDIVFSPGVKVTFENKAPMVYTMKTIHKIFSIYDIHSMVRNLQQNYRVNILINDQDIHPPHYIYNLIKNADSSQKSGHWHLYQLKKESFLSVFKMINEKTEEQRYLQQKSEFKNSSLALLRSLQKNDLDKALDHLNHLLAFFENNDAERYNLAYYKFKLILLLRLKKKTEAAILQKKLQNPPNMYEEEQIWGWNPYPWLRIWKKN